MKRILVVTLSVFSCYAPPSNTPTNSPNTIALLHELNRRGQVLQQQGPHDMIEIPIHDGEKTAQARVEEKIYSLEQKTISPRPSVGEASTTGERSRLCVDLGAPGRAEGLTVCAACCIFWPLAACTFGILKLCGL